MKVDIYRIDDDVPVPIEVTRRAPSIPISKLDVGESILFPLKQRATVQANASHLKASSGKLFTIKKVDEENARVWRVE